MVDMKACVPVDFLMRVICIKGNSVRTFRGTIMKISKEEVDTSIPMSDRRPL